MKKYRTVQVIDRHTYESFTATTIKPTGWWRHHYVVWLGRLKHRRWIHRIQP